MRVPCTSNEDNVNGEASCEDVGGVIDDVGGGGDDGDDDDDDDGVGGNDHCENL